MRFDPALHTCRRSDLTLFHLVDLACCSPDIKEASRFLATNAVPFAVAHRVLLHPTQRRRAARY